MQAHRQVLPLKSEVISSLRSSLSTPSLSQCVEELVFNSLDAKATCIAVRVDLENYRIQVVDNGCGISSEDLTLVGQRYATSKCFGLEDLNTLAFFGYRGEFLASLSNISSVLEVISRPKNSKTTFAKLFQKGEIYEIGEAKEKRPAHGTTVTAYNVFYNLPVRQKNISVALDLERIRKRLEAFAIIHHNVSFSLRDDLSGSKIFQTHATLSPKSAFGFLFGHPKANTLKEIANSHRIFSVSGYVGTEGHSNKNLQHIYINKQLVLKTKVHKLVNHFLSRSLLLKSQRVGKYPDSPGRSDPLSHCNQYSPSRGQGEHAIFILDIKCLRSEYDIQYDNHQTFLEFQDWKGVSICVEQALQQFLVSENLCLISEEEKETKKKDEGYTEDSSEESSSESEEAPSQPPPAQLAKLQKYGYNISTRNCTNNLQSRVVTRAHLKVKKQKYNVDRNKHNVDSSSLESVDSGKLEETPKKLKNNSDQGNLCSFDLLPLHDGDESLTCNTKKIQQSEDKVQQNLNDEDENSRKALNLKKHASSKNKVNKGCEQMNSDKLKVTCCMDERQGGVEEPEKLELHQQKSELSELLSKPLGKHETNKVQTFDTAEGSLVSKRNEKISTLNQNEEMNSQSSTSCKFLSGTTPRSSGISFKSDVIFLEGEDEVLKAKGQLCRGSTLAEEERDSSVVIIPEVLSYNNSNVQDESESIPVMMPSCASTLPAGVNNSLKISDDSCMKKQAFGQETFPLPQDACADGGCNKTFDNGGLDLHQKKSLDKVPHLPAPEIVTSVDSTLGCNLRKGPVKCGPTSSPSSRPLGVTAVHDRVINREEPCTVLEQIGSITEENFKLSKEETMQDSLSCHHCEAEATVSEESISMVTFEADSHKRCTPVRVSKNVHFESFLGSFGDSEVDVPVKLKKCKGERSKASLQGDGRKPLRKEFSQDQSHTTIEIEETRTYTSSLQRFKNGLKSHPVNVTANLAAKISEALNKSKAKNAIFCTNFSDRSTTSHLSRMRSQWFPVTEDNLPVDIRDAPTIRLSQKLAWLKKCKPSEKVDNFTKLKEETLSLEQSLVKDFYSERKPLSAIQRKGASGDMEIWRCQRRPKLDEIPSHPDQSSSHSFMSSRNSSEPIKRRDTLLKGSKLPCKIQKCSSSDLTFPNGQLNACFRGPGKTKAPALRTQLQNYSGHFTPENSYSAPFDRGSIAQTRTDNLSMSRAPPHSGEVHGDLQKKLLLENASSTNEVTPHCRLHNHGFMSTESFIQSARDLLPCTNPSSIKVAPNSLATYPSTNIENEGGIILGNFVNAVKEDVCHDHGKHIERGRSVSNEDKVLEKSYTRQQSRYESAACEDDGNSSREFISSSDVKAISEARHREILAMIDNPSLLSPEVEKQVGSDTHSPLICDSGTELPFSRYKDSPWKEVLSTQPFRVQSSPVEGEEDFWRQSETFGQLVSQKEDEDVEDKPSESLEISHASSSKPEELQIAENEKILDNKFSEMLPAVQGEDSNFTKDRLPSKEGSSEPSPCHMGMNWNMINEENIDLLTVTDKSLQPQAPQTGNDVENTIVPHSRAKQLQTSDEVISDLIERADPLQDEKTPSLQGRVESSCVDTAGKDDSKISDGSEVSTRVILAKDHTIVLQKTNSEHPVHKNTSFNEFKTSASHLEMSSETTVEAGVYQRECKPPNEQNPIGERVAQPCGTELSSTTAVPGLGSTLKTCATKKGSDPVPWELYWFLPKTAKPFFPRPLQDRRPAPDKTTTTQSAHVLDELLMEENETANVQSKWKHGIPHIDKEACRSFDELFDNWQNPVFKTKDADVPDSSATRSISATVKVHNSLHPYQFTKEIFDSIEVIGQLDKKFIVCLVSTSIHRTETKPHLLVLIDQHAAHERIRLEQLTQDAYVDSEDHSDSEDISSPYLKDTTVPHLRSCRVIPPVPINISDEECRLGQAFSQKLKRFGITVSISKSGKGYTAEVTELPACMVEREANMVKKARQTVATDLAEALVQESIQQLQDTAGSCASLPRTITKILNSQACRGAIKFGDPLALDDILSLLSQLSECNLPFQCAHGRPSIIPLLDFNHLTAKLHSQDSCSHHPKVNLHRFRRKIIEMVDDETNS